MARRLMQGGHQCVVHDHAAEVVQALAKDGAEPALTVEERPSRAISIVARTAPATSSRWSTTASSTA
ncbi:MAG: hypothetical protein ACREMN_08150 [Gemmatimonadales bacterium]